jgi:hypothetical protein
MQALDKDLRRTLESTVKEARDVAEEGALAAVNQIGVGEPKKPEYLSEPQAEIRRRLRARARALGDPLHDSGTQETTRLVREIAYEQWHRMLFARFLIENDLLVHPDFGVAVSLGDLDELAEEEAARDGFELAARYATEMLPQIFRQDDPVLDLEFAPEHRNTLQRLVEDLSGPVFEADDSLGWVYQFWQAKRKDEVNASGDKIGADELPAVTQLFTEDYMVQFLLDNTLGAWWTARHPDTDIGLDLKYLRFIEDEETGGKVPAAGTFDGWPDAAAELTVMDPCMGSGHFLVAALPMLARMRMHEEGLSADDAIDRVLAENLYGLEIDERCTQIGAFALAMAAWTFDSTSGYRDLPDLNIACSGLAPEGSLEEWETLAGDDERLQNGMRRLYALFQDAPTLGSLIDPNAPENRLDTATFEELEPLLKEALSEGKDAEETERGVAAYGIARAAEMMSSQYDLVTTNVPYLTRGSQSEQIKEYLGDHFPRGKMDLATALIERCIEFSSNSERANGSISVVGPQNWLFLTSYTDLRRSLLRRRGWKLAARLGPNAFESISGEVVNVGLYIISRRQNKPGSMAGIDAQEGKDASAKRRSLLDGPVVRTKQSTQLGNPDSRILLTDVGSEDLLSKWAESHEGLTTGDLPRFTNYFWEIDLCGAKWKPYIGSVSSSELYSGRSQAICWEKGEGQLHSFEGSYIKGKSAWGERGVRVKQMGTLGCTLYTGEVFDKNAGTIIPHSENHLPAIWCFLSSDKYEPLVRQMDRKVNVTIGTLVKVPFDLDHWQEVAEEEYPDGLPDPYSDDPTQWIFHGHPKPSERPLQVAVARLLGYRWPAERDEDMELSDQARAWIARAAELDKHTDDDGIVCIPAVQGERRAVDRLRDLLADAWGDDWSESVVSGLLDDYGYKGRGLAAWLSGDGTPWGGKFAKQHNKLFGNRPFIWHISDTHEDGFSALVNYHKLDKANLERLTYTYLGDWIERQKNAEARGESRAESRRAAAEDLQAELKKIIEGEPPYDVFVRWKEAHEQPIGWDPDLNDGVLINIRPFTEGDGRAGVLRDEPNVRYTKDRGKNPDGAPWGPLRYNRYEDVPDEHKLKDEKGNVIEHLTNAVKRAARDEAFSE